MNNSYSTTFENFEFGLPRLGLEDRENGQKTQKEIFEIFSKVEYLREYLSCLPRLMRKKTFDILCWEFDT
jgi:hypothetical protein